jgi:hypothetical protein
VHHVGGALAGAEEEPCPVAASAWPPESRGGRLLRGRNDITPCNSARALLRELQAVYFPRLTCSPEPCTVNQRLEMNHNV